MLDQVDHADKLLRWSRSILGSTLTHALIRRTFFAHFCGGAPRALLCACGGSWHQLQSLKLLARERCSSSSSSTLRQTIPAVLKVIGPHPPGTAQLWGSARRGGGTFHKVCRPAAARVLLTGHMLSSILDPEPRESRTCAGVDQAEVNKQMQALAEKGIGGILDYAAEDDVDSGACCSRRTCPRSMTAEWRVTGGRGSCVGMPHPSTDMACACEWLLPPQDTLPPAQTAASVMGAGLGQPLQSALVQGAGRCTRGVRNCRLP